MDWTKPWWKVLAETGGISAPTGRNPTYAGSQVGLNPMATRYAGPPMDDAALERAIVGQAPRPDALQTPAELYTFQPPNQASWPVPVPQELIRTGGAGGGFRDSNIQDATGMTGGGGLLSGGTGGGMRDSNIQDATGTTGGNAAAETKEKAFDWDGLASGFGQLGKGLKGMSRTEPDMRAPSLADDSGQRMAAASQLWQAVMQKRKPKGLI